MLARGPQTVLGFVGKRGEGGEGYWGLGRGYNEVLALEVLNVIACVERRVRAELPASASASRTVAAAPSFQACLRACMCECCEVGGKLHQTGVVYASADKYIHGDLCY